MRMRVATVSATMVSFGSDRTGRRKASTALHRRRASQSIDVLHEADAGLAGAVEIGVVGNALLLQRLHEGAAHRGMLPEMGNLHGAAHAVVRLAEMIVAFLLDEMRQEVLVAPAGAAQSLVPES